MSKTSRSIVNVASRPDGGFVYSQPGSAIAYTAHPEQAAAKAMQQAALHAKAARARMEAAEKQKAAQEAEQAAIAAEAAASAAKVETEKAETEKQSWWGRLIAAVAKVFNVNGLIGPKPVVGMRPGLIDPYLRKATSVKTEVAHENEDLATALDKSLKPAGVTPPPMMANPANLGRPAPAEKPYSGQSPTGLDSHAHPASVPAGSPRKNEKGEPESKEAKQSVGEPPLLARDDKEAKQSVGEPPLLARDDKEAKQSVGEPPLLARDDKETKPLFEKIEETADGYRVVFPDKFEMLVPKSDPAAKVFETALDETGKLTDQYQSLLQGIEKANAEPPTVSAPAPVRPELMEGVIVRMPDSPNGTARFALELPNSKWQALNLDPKAMKLLEEMDQKKALDKATVSMSPQWEVALKSLHLNGQVLSLDEAIKNTGKVLTPERVTPETSRSAAGEPAPESEEIIRFDDLPVSPGVASVITDKATSPASTNIEAAPATPEAAVEFQSADEISPEIAVDPVIEPEAPAADAVVGSEMDNVATGATQIPSEPAQKQNHEMGGAEAAIFGTEPVLASVEPEAQSEAKADSRELESGTIIYLESQKACCIGLRDGLFKLNLDLRTVELFQTVAKEGVFSAGISRNPDGSIKLEAVAAENAEPQLALNVVGYEPTASLLEDEKEQASWKTFVANLEIAQKAVASANPETPLTTQSETQVEAPTSLVADAEDKPFRSYEAARDGERLEPVKVDGPGI